MTSVIVGYASLDFAQELANWNSIDATSIVQNRISECWPSLGGVFHHCKAIMEVLPETENVTAVSWVGEDPSGQEWVTSLSRLGIDTSGVGRSDHSPESYLYYLPDGAALCFFNAGKPMFTDTQREKLASASNVLLCVGPPEVAQFINSVPKPKGALMWSVKGDSQAFPRSIRHELIRKADVVSYSIGEREFLDLRSVDTGGTVLVETRGRDGLAWSCASLGVSHEIIPISNQKKLTDTTGAGDTFAGVLFGLLVERPHQSVQQLRTLLEVAQNKTGEILAYRNQQEKAKRT